MILRLYSLRDSLVGFTSPVSFTSDETAIRSFSNLINSDETVAKNREYLSLYYVCDFDDESGICNFVEDSYNCICRGIDIPVGSDDVVIE